MRILVFGALNIDQVYQVEHFVRPGETISTTGYSCDGGGKAYNQAVAFARAGVLPYHAGAVGKDGLYLLDKLEHENIDTRHIRTLEDVPTGQAIIQVDRNGENCILLYGGANHAISSDFIEETLSAFEPGDWLVLQNEINGLEEITHKAVEKGLRIIWNPSPIPEDWRVVPTGDIFMLVLNEVEAEAICKSKDMQAQMEGLRKAFPRAEIVLTLGGQGSLIYDPADGSLTRQEAVPAKVVDTTAAGDTFLGYYVAMRSKGKSVRESAYAASCAASRAIALLGAAESIPKLEELGL